MSSQPHSDAPTPTRRFLNINDLIKSDELETKQYGTDWCIVLHNPGEDTSSSIRSKGLMSLERQAQEPDASDTVKIKYSENLAKHSLWFDSDPTKIYSRPTIDSGSNAIKVGPDHIVLACHPSAVSVYNSEWRKTDRTQPAYVTKGRYQGSSMPLSTWRSKVESLMGTSKLDRRGAIVPRHAREDESYDNEFIAEVVIDAPHIDPSFFIPHHLIPEHLLDYDPRGQSTGSTLSSHEVAGEQSSTKTQETAATGSRESDGQSSKLKSWRTRTSAQLRRRFKAVSDAID